MGGCLAQLGCSGEVWGTSVGFVIAFSVPAPFCLQQGRAARPVCLRPAPCPGHGTNNTCLTLVPESTFVQISPRAFAEPFGLFALPHPFLVRPKQTVPVFPP